MQHELFGQIPDSCFAPRNHFQFATGDRFITDREHTGFYIKLDDEVGDVARRAGLPQPLNANDGPLYASSRGHLLLGYHIFPSDSVKAMRVPTSWFSHSQSRAPAPKEQVDKSEEPVKIDGDRPNYYAKYGEYTPTKVIQKWGLNFCLGNVLKYICRAGTKEGESELKDLIKARNFITDHIDWVENNS